MASAKETAKLKRESIKGAVKSLRVQGESLHFEMTIVREIDRAQRRGQSLEAAITSLRSKFDALAVVLRQIGE